MTFLKEDLGQSFNVWTLLPSYLFAFSSSCAIEMSHEIIICVCVHVLHGNMHVFYLIMISLGKCK